MSWGLRWELGQFLLFWLTMPREKILQLMCSMKMAKQCFPTEGITSLESNWNLPYPRILVIRLPSTLYSLYKNLLFVSTVIMIFQPKIALSYPHKLLLAISPKYMLFFFDLYYFFIISSLIAASSPATSFTVVFNSKMPLLPPEITLNFFLFFLFFFFWWLRSSSEWLGESLSLG